MVQSLENLSLTALASTFWDNHTFAPTILLTLEKHIPLVARFAQQVDVLPLPKLHKINLKLAILETGKRKIAKKCKKLELGLATKRPCSRDEALREFLPIKYFHDHPDIPPYFRAPPIGQYFQETPQRMIVVDFFFALILPNPRDDPSAIAECWTSPAFVPVQSIFLDNFTNIWQTIESSQLPSTYEEITENVDRYNAINGLYLWIHRNASVNNETIPWFVFDVLSEGQRDKIFALGESSMIGTCMAFRIFFATIFCHWPWQDEAFEKYFAGKQELSNNDVAVLNIVLDSKRKEESGALNMEIFPAEVSFYLRVKNFFDARISKRDKRRRRSNVIV